MRCGCDGSGLNPVAHRAAQNTPYKVFEIPKYQILSHEYFNYQNIKYVFYKKLSYCWETVRRESMPRIAEMDVEMTT